MGLVAFHLEIVLLQEFVGPGSWFGHETAGFQAVFRGELSCFGTSRVESIFLPWASFIGMGIGSDGGTITS